MFPLRRQDMEVVTAIRRRSAAPPGRIALSNRVRHQRSDGTQGFVGGHLPIETVMLPCIAEDGLGILRVPGKREWPTSRCGQFGDTEFPACPPRSRNTTHWDCA